jgi:hypothetical protein
MILLDAETSSAWHSVSFMSFWTVREHFIIWCGQVVLDKRLKSEKNITCNFWCFRGFETVGVEMKIQEVRAKALGLKNTFGLSKAELIRRIQKSEGNFDCFGTAKDYCDQFQCCFKDDCFRFVKDWFSRLFRKLMPSRFKKS